ncbi:MAG: hypothetical protein ACOCTT_00110 [archaeon]
MEKNRKNLIKKTLLLQTAVIILAIMMLSIPTYRAKRLNQVTLPDTTIYDVASGETAPEGMNLQIFCEGPNEYGFWFAGCDDPGASSGEGITDSNGIIEKLDGEYEGKVYTEGCRHGYYGNCMLAVNTNEDIKDLDPDQAEIEGASGRWRGTVSKEDLIRYENWEDNDPEQYFQGLEGTDSYDQSTWATVAGWTAMIIIIIVLTIITGGLFAKVGALMAGQTIGAGLLKTGLAYLGVKAFGIGVGIGVIVTWLTGAANYLGCQISELWDDEACVLERKFKNTVIGIEPTGPEETYEETTTTKVDNVQVEADNVVTDVKVMTRHQLNEYLIGQGLNQEVEDTSSQEIIRVIEGPEYPNCRIAPNYGYIDGDTTRPLEGELRIENATANESMILNNETYKFTVEDKPGSRNFEITAQKLTENTKNILEEMPESVGINQEGYQGPCVSSYSSTPLESRIMNFAMEPASPLKSGDVYTPSPIYEGERAGYIEEINEELRCAPGDELVSATETPDSKLLRDKVLEEADIDNYCEVSPENFAERMVPCGEGQAAPVGYMCAEKGEKTCPLGSLYNPATEKCMISQDMG